MRFWVLLAFLALAGGITYFFLTTDADNQSLVSPLPVIFPTATIPPKSSFSLEQAPSESLRGTIATLAGEVSYVGRIATEAAIISPGQPVQQGENYLTGAESSVTINFGEAVRILMEENAEVDVIQTLPGKMVFSQVDGIVTYMASENVTVRTAYLLTQLNGEVRIGRDSAKSMVTVDMASGSAVAAYNDGDYQSHTIELETGQVLQFNYDTRQVAQE